MITGFGSDRLRAAGASLVGDFKGLSVTGLTEALPVIRRSWHNYRALVRDAEQSPPDVFVPIDFPDFNFFPARALHKRGVPVVYYISPAALGVAARAAEDDEAGRRSGAGDLSRSRRRSTRRKACRSRSSAIRCSS